MIKQILLIFVLLTSSLLATNTETDLRLNHYPRAIKWLQDADTNGESANNLGILYYKTIKDNQKAIRWLEKAYKLNKGILSGQSANSLGYIYDDLKKYKEAEKWYKIALNYQNIDAPLNLGLMYKKLHQYDDAIFYYKKAYKMGNADAATSLGYLYGKVLNNPEQSYIWLYKASKNGDLDAIKNLAHLNYSKNKKVEGGAYFIALIDLKYSKQKVITYLKTKWHLTDKELQQAYKLQQTLDIPKHYTGGID